ncbi:MAG: nucleoside triphosphate pyrophosphohydrolase [Clostridia bacterium]|nr:nucleoside triphosphate pyrophosphohydrolase [Clostridia bacterium]
MSEKNEIAALLSRDRYTFDDLARITGILRSDEGCPWDREQDHHSIRKCLIEETYEVVEAIDNEDPVLLREELGDLLFQVMFHAQIEAEEGRFCVDDVVDDISKKMIHRHPHVFGTTEVENSQQVLANWETIKTEEKQRNTLVEKLRAIPPMMPALMRASKVGKKAGVEVDSSPEEQLNKLEADIQAVKAALTSPQFDAKAEIGILLMRVTALARALDVDAEHALFCATERLIEDIASKKA